MWRFHRIGGDSAFTITSWTHDSDVLCSNENGEVFTANTGKNKEKETCEIWTVSLHSTGKGVRIQSAKYGKLLAFSGHDLYTVDREEGTAWELEPAHSNQFFISATCHDKRLSTTKDYPLTQSNRSAEEKWVIESDVIGRFTIRSKEHGMHLGSSDDGSIVISESKQTSWTIGSSPHGSGGVFIQSAEHCKRLSCDDNGHPYTTDSSGGWETWRLEPILPNVMTRKTMWSLVGIGIGMSTMPFAVMGAIGAIGFEAGGIAAGSMAAGMMSSSGGVVAGGTVATLQSIGAAGLGAAGASAAATAGAAVGGLTSLSVAAATNSLVTEQQMIRQEEPERHLPLCSWRMWNQMS